MTAPTSTGVDDSPAKPARLTGQLGVGAIVFMVIAAAAPLTVIGGNVPLAVAGGNGVGAPVGFLLAATVLLVFAVGFVTMTPHVREAGAFFSYVTTGLGSRAGLGAAFVALVAYTAVQVGVYGYMGWAANDLVTFFGGPSVPWPVYSFLTMAVVAVLGYRHIELSAKVLGVALVLEIAVMVALDVAVFATGGAAGPVWSTFTPSNVLSPGLGVAVLFALTGFIGFEATAVFRDEARTPERTIPRATYLAVTIIGVFYALSCWALVTAAGAADAVPVAQRTLDGEGNMMLDTARAYLGTGLRDVMNVLLITSLFACVLSFHNVLARYQFTLAHKGVLPARLGRTNPRHHAPSTASLVQTATAAVVLLVLALVGLDPLVGVFGSMAGVSTIGMVLLMTVTSVAVVVYFSRHPRAARGRVLPTRVAPVVAILGLLACAWLVVSNFTLVTGGSVAVSTVLALVPPAAFVLGLVLGGRYSLLEDAEESGADVVG
ncbi:Amino acid transporter [Microlunatus sagamiharensis]|uniref:Amino acid transporter n=1 Tax=Microlunatus sagamiharensis TaxID=546874 RepID=A0A1H2MUR7_9ACTN|nr:APC family permease [Microlunatus sagamiharensis]SDU96967.1 Amino acid transporter [Microlunatus sagamiharensis]